AVPRADRLLALEALEIPPVSLTRASWLRVAEAVTAARIVVGRLELKGDAVELQLRLLDAERGTLSAPLQASGAYAGLPELVDGLAWDVALATAARPPRSQAELSARHRAPPLEALKAYALGLHAPDATARVRALKHALQLASGFDEARLELGRLQLLTREHA